MDITASQLRKKIENKEPFQLIDVRLSFEVQYGTIAGAVHIPLKALPDSLDKLDKEKEIIIYCHSGGRSNYAADYLCRLGYNAKSLAGGIEEWKKSELPHL